MTSRHAFAPVHQRAFFCPDKGPSTLVDEACAMIRTEMDSLPLGLTI